MSRMSAYHSSILDAAKFISSRSSMGFTEVVNAIVSYIDPEVRKLYAPTIGVEECVDYDARLKEDGNVEVVCHSNGEPVFCLTLHSRHVASLLLILSQANCGAVNRATRFAAMIATPSES